MHVSYEIAARIDVSTDRRTDDDEQAGHAAVRSDVRRRDGGDGPGLLSLRTFGDRSTGRLSLCIRLRAYCRSRGDVLSRLASWSAKRRFIYILADDAA